MLKTLAMSGFRGFESYRLTGLARVNLVVGKNNSGKTSVLEAMDLLMSGGVPRPCCARARGERSDSWACVPFESFRRGGGARGAADKQSRLDGALAGQRRMEAGLERARSAHTEAEAAYNRRYRSVIDAGAEVARTEESIQSIRRRRDEIAGTLREETARLEAARRQIESERRQREEVAARLARDEPALAELKEQSSSAHRELGRLEEDVRALGAEFDALSEREREPARIVHAEQTRIQHFESGIGELESRAQALESERGTIDPDALEQEAEPVRRRIAATGRGIAVVGRASTGSLRARRKFQGGALVPWDRGLDGVTDRDIMRV